MTDKLKACPFCGGSVYIDSMNGWHFVTHVKPTPKGCIGASFQGFLDQNALIAAWNKRKGQE